MTERQDWTPRPDPTLLTTQQLLRELASLREIIETRLDAMDRAAVLLDATVNRTPTVIQTAVSNLREVYDERFRSIQQQLGDRNRTIDERFRSIGNQFIERDVRTEQAAKGGKEALDAALLAAKELVAQQNEANRGEAAKTEQNFTKQIDAQAARIDELKERIDRGEGQSGGVEQSQSRKHLDDEIMLTRQGQSMQRIALLISAFLAIITIATFILYVTKK